MNWYFDRGCIESVNDKIWIIQPAQLLLSQYVVSVFVECFIFQQPDHHRSSAFITYYQSWLISGPLCRVFSTLLRGKKPWDIPQIFKIFSLSLKYYSCLPFCNISLRKYKVHASKTQIARKNCHWMHSCQSSWLKNRGAHLIPRKLMALLSLKSFCLILLI